VLNSPHIFYGSTGKLSLGLLILDVSVSHTDTLLSVRLLSKSGRLLAEKGTRQRIQYSQETHIFGPWRDSNLQSHYSVGHRPTPYTTRPLKSAIHNLPQVPPAAALIALMKYKEYFILTTSAGLLVTRVIM
jgi:hypothetical protein